MRRYLKTNKTNKPIEAEKYLMLSSILNFPMDERLDSALAKVNEIRLQLDREFNNIKDEMIKFLDGLKKELKRENTKKLLNSSNEHEILTSYRRRVYSLVENINKINQYLSLDVESTKSFNNVNVLSKLSVSFSMSEAELKKTKQRVILNEHELRDKLNMISPIIFKHSTIEYDTYKELLDRTSLLPTLFKSKDFRHFRRLKLKDILEITIKGGYSDPFSYTKIDGSEFNYYLGCIIYGVENLVNSLNKSFNDVEAIIIDVSSQFYEL